MGVSNMDHDYARQRLRHALRAPLEGFKELESALIEYERSIAGEAQQRPQERDSLQLLSVQEVCQQLGMGKSWVYRRLRSGEIPSVKLGRSIKVMRADLETYLEQHRNAVRPAQNSS